MTKFKVGDRVRDIGTDRKGTVTSVIDEGSVGILWDAEGACSTIFLTKIDPDPDETRTVDDLTDEEIQARGLAKRVDFRGRTWIAATQIRESVVTCHVDNGDLYVDGQLFGCRLTVAQFDRFCAVKKEIEGNAA